jgi:hypothetical protein
VLWSRSCLHTCMTSIALAIRRYDPITEWVSSRTWNVGLTVQPANPYYTADDVALLGNTCCETLCQRLFTVEEQARRRRDLWIAFRTERSKGKELEHLHVLVHLTSNNRVKEILRYAQQWLLPVCESFAATRRSSTNAPSVHVFTANTGGMKRWQDYLKKDCWRDRRGDRWGFGLPT